MVGGCQGEICKICKRQISLSLGDEGNVYNSISTKEAVKRKILDTCDDCLKKEVK